MTNFYEAMTGWTEEGLRQVMAEEKHKQNQGRVITLNDVANRLVALADRASQPSDIYGIILDEDTLHSEVEAAIELGSTGRAPSETAIQQSAEDAIDLTARVLIIKARQLEAAKQQPEKQA